MAQWLAAMTALTARGWFRSSCCLPSALWVTCWCRSLHWGMLWWRVTLLIDSRYVFEPDTHWAVRNTILSVVHKMAALEFIQGCSKNIETQFKWQTFWPVMWLAGKALCAMVCSTLYVPDQPKSRWAAYSVPRVLYTVYRCMSVCVCVLFKGWMCQWVYTLDWFVCRS